MQRTIDLAPTNTPLFSAAAQQGSYGPTALYQKTLGGVVQASGVGVHSGETITLKMLPAEPDTGIVFVRDDLKNGARTIPADYAHIVDTRLCTKIGNSHGGEVATIEHLMAALRAFEISNVTILVDGPEVPVLDGSAAQYIELIEAVGVIEQRTAPRKEIVILKPVEITDGIKTAKLLPSTESRFDLTIEFPDQKLIQTQTLSFALSLVGFKKEIAAARTFCRFEEVEQAQKVGLMLGGSLDNAVVFKNQQVMNEGGLRFTDEPVRHKLLDAIGDLSMAGLPIRGQYIAHYPGHDLNGKLLKALFADPSAYQIVTTAAYIAQQAVRG